MLYSENVPSIGTSPSYSQPYILQNFRSIYEFMNVDHFTFNDPNAGKHKRLSFPEQFTIASTELINIGVKKDENTNVRGLATKIGSSEANIIFPATRTNKNNASEGSFTIRPSGTVIGVGYSLVPSQGIDIQFPKGVKIDKDKASIIATCYYKTANPGSILGDPNCFKVANVNMTSDDKFFVRCVKAGQSSLRWIASYVSWKIIGKRKHV